MFALIFEKGMVTLSWYAWLALRRRVSMSAIGSVIVMGIRQPFSPGFPVTRRAYGEAVLLKIRRRSAVRAVAGWLEGDYQEALDTPGSSPRWAMSRMHTRHRPNLRYTECGRPHRWQRVYARTANFGFRAALRISAFFAMLSSP